MVLEINFDKSILEGSAVLEVEKIDPKATEVVLDARGLNIRAISDEQTGQALKFDLHPEDYVGSKLEAQLPLSEATK